MGLTFAFIRQTGSFSLAGFPWPFSNHAERAWLAREAGSPSQHSWFIPHWEHPDLRSPNEHPSTSPCKARSEQVTPGCINEHLMGRAGSAGKVPGSPQGPHSRVGDTGLVYGSCKGYVKSHLRLVAEHDHGLWHIVFPFTVLLQECGVTWDLQDAPRGV